MKQGTLGQSTEGCFWALKFLKSGTKMSDRDSKILVELREVFDTQ